MSDREERTEAPSPQRRKRVRDEGRVVRSRDLVAVSSVLVVLWIARHLGESWLLDVETSVSRLLRGAVNARPMSEELALGALGALGVSCFGLLAPIALFAGGTSLVASFAQTGWLLRPQRVFPSWRRLGPRHAGSGSPGSLWRGALAATKCVWLVFALVWALEPIARIGFAEDLLAGRSLREGLARSARHVLDSALLAASGLFALAVLDWSLRKWKFERSLRMTRHEAREERAEEETPDEVRRGRRRLNRANAERRGLASRSES